MTEQSDDTVTFDWGDQVQMALDHLDRRVRDLETKTKDAPVRAVAETKRLRALAIQLNQQLDGDKSETARKLQRRRWVREFAAAALPTVLLQSNGHRDAARDAFVIALDLWEVTQNGLRNLDKTDAHERKEPQETE